MIARKIKIYASGLLLLLLGLLVSPATLYAQGVERLAELERLALSGGREELLDSLAILSQFPSGPEGVARLARVEALLACREGRVAEAQGWYEGLSLREKKQAENLSLAILFGIQGYDLEQARQGLQQLGRLRLKDPEGWGRLRREALVGYRDEVERLLGHIRVVEVWDTVSGPVEEILERLRLSTLALGRSDRGAYLSPDGTTQWVVATGADDRPAFRVVHQLGDGSWDEANAEVVEVRGLPEGAELSYPWLMSDGNTLYFAVEQKGILPAMGLGGMDIYVSRYDRAAGVLLVPQLLPMPFNSPADDLIYMADELNDVGWLVTSRGLRNGAVRLYTFRLSSIQRYEGTVADAGEVALWHQPMMKDGGYPEVPAAVVQPNSYERVYFWIHQQPIRGVGDLKNMGAQSLFQHFVSRATALEQLEDRFRGVRQQISDGSLEEVDRYRGEILNMEERVEVLRAETRALRNEVIGMEVGKH